jgi:lipopolysaccharide transport system ATP-binding protein
MSDAIVVSGLGKRYRRYDPNRPTTLKGALISGFRRLRPTKSFWALREVSFRVGRGRMVGVVGRNGAGKSTLLRLVGGVGRPDEGGLDVRGRVGALLEVGEGFNGDLTGRENAIIGGIVRGLTRAEVERQIDDVIEFAELGSFIDDPFRTYSSGMKMRLAFSVAIHSEPDILLIDETLTVGDLAFQRKCLERIDRLRVDGCAILLVSHDERLIRQTCDEAIWLRGGRAVASGAADVVVGQYVAEIETETRHRTPAVGPSTWTAGGVQLKLHENRFGSLELEIVGVRLLDDDDVPITDLASGDALKIEIDYDAHGPVVAPVFGITVTDADQRTCCDLYTSDADLSVPTVHGRGTITLDIERLDLAGGQYMLDVAAYERDWAYAYDHHWKAYALTIRPRDSGGGLIRPPHRWRMASEP